MSGKRQVVPLMDVRSSAEPLGRLTVADDRGKPVASNDVHARITAIHAAAATAEAKHISVKWLYGTTPLKNVDRISTLLFPPW